MRAVHFGAEISVEDLLERFWQLMDLRLLS